MTFVGRLRNIFPGCQRVIFSLGICVHRWLVSVCYVCFVLLFGDRMPANLIAVPNLWISFSNCHHVICFMSTDSGTLPSRYWQFEVAGWCNQNYTVSYWVSTFPVNEFRRSPWRDATWHVTPSQTRWLDNADVTGYKRKHETACELAPHKHKTRKWSGVISCDLKRLDIETNFVKVVGHWNILSDKNASGRSALGPWQYQNKSTFGTCSTPWPA